jgi:hypothetical protein
VEWLAEPYQPLAHRLTSKWLEGGTFMGAPPSHLLMGR